MRTLGIILIVVGLLTSVFTGFTLITEKRVAHIGKLEIDREEKTPVYWPPVAGIIVLAAGAILYMIGRKSRA